MLWKRLKKTVAAVLFFCMVWMGWTGNAAGSHTWFLTQKAEAAAKDKQTYTYEQTKKSLSAFRGVQADLDCIDLQIKPSADSHEYLSYKLHCYNKKNPLHWQVKNGILYLEESNFSPAIRKNGLAWTTSDTVTIYVPAEKVLNSFALHMGDGDLSINGMGQEKGFCNSVSIVADTGDVAIAKQKFSGSASIETKDGDLSLSDVRFSGSTKISTQVGDIAGRNVRAASSVSVSTKDGDISFADSAFSGSIFIQTQVGDIAGRNVQIKGSAKLLTDDGDISFVSSTLSGSTNVSTKDGDIAGKLLRIPGTSVFSTDDGDISLATDDLSGRLKLRTADGDVEVAAPEKVYKMLNISLSTKDGEISAKSYIGGRKSRNGGKLQYKKTIADSLAKLEIATECGDISLR
ncbi:MAG: DUF4097 domain-containing protein [Eubacterium sp.]|nr:DUF4097 domain-containing protein [Eubacterium sp.]